MKSSMHPQSFWAKDWASFGVVMIASAILIHYVLVMEFEVSYASLLHDIGKALIHPKSVAYTCAHLFSLLDTVLVNIMSENTGCARQG